MKNSITSLSKFLSLILRHSPERIGIRLDEGGWTSIAALLDAANAAGRKLDHELLLQIVQENTKQRFAISPDGLRIRANQGHSVSVDLGLAPRQPPDKLFHGTVAKFIDSIRSQGLISGNRQHVHLSTDRDTAEIVGRRRGTPIILSIDASRMASSGFSFFLSANCVWLTHHVPVDYIQFPGDT